MDTRVITEQSDFDALKNSWDHLFDESGTDNIFLSYTWLNTWWEFFGKNKKLYIVAVSENGRLIGIAPLMIQSRYGFEEMCFISEGYSDYEGFLLDGKEHQKKEILQAILQRIIDEKKADILRINQIRESGQAYGALKECNRGVMGKHKEGAPYVESIHDWETYYARLPKRIIKDTERQVARLRKMGDLVFLPNASDETEVGERLKELMEMHISRRKEAGGQSLFCDQLTKEFFRAVTVHLFRQGILRLASLKLDNETAAIHLGIQVKKKFYYYIPSFNADFRPYSIGRILQIEIMKEAFQSGADQFDFMLGEELYKMIWNPAIEPLHYFSMALNNHKGEVFSAIIHRIIIPLKKILGKSW